MFFRGLLAALVVATAMIYVVDAEETCLPDRQGVLASEALRLATVIGQPLEMLLPNTIIVLDEEKEEKGNIIVGSDNDNNVGGKRKNETSTKGFRNYSDVSDEKNARVVAHYTLMRREQTMEYVKRMQREWSGLDKAELNLREAFKILEDYVDSSDPDFGLPNVLHNLQTAEAIREAGLPDWMQLVGVLHDVGKLQFAWGRDEDGQSGKRDGKQFALGGDTWIVGARIPDSVVLPELNVLNPDMQDERYNTTFGIYERGVGLWNVNWCWGHDEYMFRVLEKQSTIPKEGLAMVRLHSAYPWHQQGEYTWFETEEDVKLIPWIKLFNRFDLYEKKKTPPPDVEALLPYYEDLFNKYIPTGKLRF